jgi:hypothetical protein
MGVSTNGSVNANRKYRDPCTIKHTTKYHDNIYYYVGRERSLAFSLLLTSPVQDSWPRHNTQTSDRTKQTAGNIMAPVRAANVVFKVLGPTAFTLAARTWVVWTPPGGVNLWAMHRPLGASAAGRGHGASHRRRSSGQARRAIAINSPSRFILSYTSNTSGTCLAS